MFSRTISTLDCLLGINKEKTLSRGYLKLFAAQFRSRSQKWIAMPGKNWIASPTKLVAICRDDLLANLQVNLQVSVQVAATFLTSLLDPRKRAELYIMQLAISFVTLKVVR
jgi:hypothetical protein